LQEFGVSKFEYDGMVDSAKSDVFSELCVSLELCTFELDTADSTQMVERFKSQVIKIESRIQYLRSVMRDLENKTASASLVQSYEVEVIGLTNLKCKFVLEMNQRAMELSGYFFDHDSFTLNSIQNKVKKIKLSGSENVLCIEAIGLRAMSVIPMLEQLEKESGKAINQMFDTFIGIGTSAPIAYCLARIGLDTQILYSFFDSLASIVDCSIDGDQMWLYDQMRCKRESKNEQLEKLVQSFSSQIQEKQQKNGKLFIVCSKVVTQGSLQSCCFCDGECNDLVLQSTLSCPYYFLPTKMGDSLFADGSLTSSHPLLLLFENYNRALCLSNLEWKKSEPQFVEPQLTYSDTTRLFLYSRCATLESQIVQSRGVLGPKSVRGQSFLSKEQEIEFERELHDRNVWKVYFELAAQNWIKSGMFTLQRVNQFF